MSSTDTGAEKKVVVVTGASRGIGKLAAINLAKRGHTVYAAMREPTLKNEAIATELRTLAEKENLTINIVELDVTDDTSVKETVESIMKENLIDVFVNNAGVMNVGVTEGFNLEQVRQQFEVNFFGVVRTMLKVLPSMRERKSGLIINVSSLAGRATFPFFGLYCASKYALEALTEAYRYELKEFGVDAVIVQPGPHKTDLVDTTPTPHEESVLATYNEHPTKAKTVLENFNTFFAEQKEISDPGLVANEIVGLVESTERRPLRTVVGVDFGVKAMNEAVEPIQNELIKGIGLEEML